MIKLARIKVYGKVQGVFFRESARQEAGKLGLAGFARNEGDGAVYIEVEGGDEELKKFVDWCRRGPEMAKVEKIEVDYSDEFKNYEGFEIV